MQILSFGIYIPDTFIDTNSLYKDCSFYSDYKNLKSGNKIENSWFKSLTTNRTVLNKEYLTNSLNSDISKSLQNVSASSTLLGSLSIDDALNKAKLKRNSIGLILTDVCTNIETCPSEAHRIGGQLGLKIPCFDLIGLGSGAALHVEYLQSMKNSVLPSYLASVSTNTPTMMVDYNNYIEGCLFGDAAVSLILDPHTKDPIPGAFQIIGAESFTDSIQKIFGELGTYEPIKIFDPESFFKYSKEKLEYVYKYVQNKFEINEDNLSVYGRVPAEYLFFANSSFIKRNKYFSTLETYGDSLSSNSLVAFIENFELADNKEFHLIIFSGLDANYGYLLLKQN